MIKVSFLYPTVERGRFDMDYYMSTHLDLSRRAFEKVLKGMSIDRGLSGVEPGTPAPYHVMPHLLFDSAEDFYCALMPRLEELKGDVTNYSDAEAVIQISEVRT